MIAVIAVRHACAALAVVLATGAPLSSADERAGQDTVRAATGPLAGLSLDRATEDRLLALDPERISP
ncbi:MAG TPA: hypothetical protein VLD36_14450, partial [Burkholderiales bacterium]|nr:hypothetical protein [Burkholderiales bacterium]